MDLFARTQAEFQNGQAEFLNSELATCSRCVDLAAGSCKNGKSGHFTDRQMADAEEAYASIDRLLADPKFSKHVSIKILQETQKRMQELRTRLDELRRDFSKSEF